MYSVWGKHPSEKCCRRLGKLHRDRTVADSYAKHYRHKGYLDVFVRASTRATRR